QIIIHCQTLTLLLIAVACSSLALAEDWPQWRGPQGTGVSTEVSLATKWSKESDNIVWRTPLPGPGGATPVIWGERLFVSSADGDHLVLICLNSKTGNQLWRAHVADGNQLARAGEGNSASASPSTDGKHVWAFFGVGQDFSSGVLACYDFEGNEIWKFDVADRFGRIDIQFGMTSTPVLHGDHLYLQLIHGAMKRGDDSRTGKIIKLDKLTGETVWAVDRVTDAEFECKHSYASPFLYDDGHQQFLVAHGANCTTGHDLKTGQELWRFSGLNGPTELNPRDYDFTFRFVASPGMAKGAIVIPTCKRGPTVTINVNSALHGEVDSTSAATRWSLPETPDVSIPLIVGDLAYLLHVNGRVQCVDMTTGEQLYFERTHDKAAHRASPVFADGHIYYCARDGVCTVIKAGREFEIVAYNSLEEPITASPAIADGLIYIRTYDALYAIKK
ncbi:MAG: PQQ-binding-like beta-propeller repeat protein, partial [Planctomycetales bacterium]|nr:PQQ-binding-like beta-propeller repeat protein [Planctomycetales bacterium]